MSLHLVTGFRGSAHITSADQGAFNAGVVGSGDYVMETGKQFEAQVISNNQIRVLDGDISMQGRHICLKKDTFEDVVIANGLQGMNRNDLIVVRYTKDANTGVEDTVFAVIQGVSTDADASDPAYTTGDILSGECLLHEMPLYRVPLNGLNVGDLVPLFKTAPTVNSIPQVEVTNESTVTTAGKAMDARQANPNVEGSLAAQIEKNKSSIEEVGNSLNVRYNEEKDMIQIFFGGEWVDWKQGGMTWKYLFRDGVIDTDIASLVEFGFNGSSGSTEIGESVISITTVALTNNGRRQGVRTNIPIDLTNVDKISFDFVSPTSDTISFISLVTDINVDPYSGNNLKVLNNPGLTGIKSGTLEYDVSNITGSYYICFGVVCGSTTSATSTINNLKIK